MASETSALCLLAQESTDGGIIGWPTAVTIIVVAALVVFRAPITQLLTRITTLKVPGAHIRVGAAQQQQRPEREPSAEAFKQLMSAFDDPLIVEQEARIEEDLRSRRITDPSQQNEVLIRHLAGAQLALYLEQLNGPILGSQLMLLSFLNAVGQTGASEELAKTSYERAAATQPDVYANFSYSSWIGF